MLFLALAAPAHATMPTWKWEAGKEYRYHLESEFRQPKGIDVRAVLNTNARAVMVHFSADTTCKAKAQGKNTVMDCRIDHMKMTGTAWSAEQEKFDAIAAEYSTRFLDAQVYMLLGADGRIKEFDIDGLKQTNYRVGQINEQMSTYLARTFSVFHMPLPADAKDFVRGWMDPAPTSLLALPSFSGTVGSMNLKHIEDGQAYGLTRIGSEAHGTLASGDSVDMNQGQLLDTRAVSVALVDNEAGQMLYREYTMDARYTASAEQNSTDAYLYQISSLQAVDSFNADGSAPLPISALRQPRRSVKPADPPTGVPLVAFSTLGMAPLFLVMPPEKVALGLPNNVMKVRLQLDANGSITKVDVFEGYEILAETLEMAIKGASFPKQAGPYAVDVDVEMRTK